MEEGVRKYMSKGYYDNNKYTKMESFCQKRGVRISYRK